MLSYVLVSHSLSKIPAPRARELNILVNAASIILGRGMMYFKKFELGKPHNILSEILKGHKYTWDT